MSAKQIHNMRRKFISISMLSFFVVILLIGSLINLSNFIIQSIEIEYSLDEILDKKNSIEDKDENISELRENLSIIELFSPSYQRNTFYVFEYDNQGHELSFSASRGNTYREDVIRQMSKTIMSLPTDKGQHGMYFYEKKDINNSVTELALIDCTYVIYYRERLLYATLGIGFIGLIASFILVLFFSKKAIEPEIRNNEKQIQFLTNVSHELKTPLAVILSNAEMEEITNGETEYTRSTIRQVNRMNGLIKNLVMISKTRENANQNILSPVNISSITMETLHEFAAMAKGENHTIVDKVEDNLYVKSDESMIRQLLMILIDNAIKYCDDGGVITITLQSIKRSKRNVKLTISNHYSEGENVDYSKFFDRFYRQDKSHNIDSEKTGYGIGLSIAENIVEQNNGDISASWKDGVISFVCELM